MARYLLVDDRDGRVLAELASAQQAVLLLGRLERNPHGTPQVSLVRLDRQQRSVTDITSMVSVRSLPPLVERRARIKRPPDRLPPRSPSTQTFARP